MNVKPATHPLATEEIGGMMKMIQTLIEKGYAYEVDGTVYYRTRNFKDYGKLSHKNLDDLEVGQEILVTGEERKRRSAGFRTLETKERGRNRMGISMGRRKSRMAY